MYNIYGNELWTHKQPPDFLRIRRLSIYGYKKSNVLDHCLPVSLSKTRFYDVHIYLFRFISFPRCVLKLRKNINSQSYFVLYKIIVLFPQLINYFLQFFVFCYPAIIAAITRLAIKPEAVDSNAPASVHLVFVIPAAIKYTDMV